MKIFKMKEPISTMFQGRFQYYYREPFGYICRDGVDTHEVEYEEVDIDLNELKVKIKEITNPFRTNQKKNLYYFSLNDEDIYIENYDSDSETFVERLVKNLPKENVSIIE